MGLTSPGRSRGYLVARLDEFAMSTNVSNIVVDNSRSFGDVLVLLHSLSIW